MMTPAFPAAVERIKCKTKCHFKGSGIWWKTKIHFCPFRVEISFSLQPSCYPSQLASLLLYFLN